MDRQRLKWGLRCLVLGSCLVALLVGCLDLSLLAPKEPVTIRFAHPGSASYYEPMVEEFQKTHEHVTIELVTGNFFGPEQLAEVDVFLTPQFGLSDLVAQDYPISLNTFLQEDDDFTLDDFYPGAVEALSIQGQRWAVPYMADLMMMFYNRDLFDKYEVPYPDVDWTWDSFLERAQRLSHPDQGEYGFAYQQMGMSGLFEPMLLMYQHGGRLFDDLSNPTMMVLNDPYNVSAMQWYADLIHRHAVAPPPGARSQPYPQRGIEGGKYAMWTGFFSEEWEDLNVGRATLPRDENALTFGIVLGFMISAESEDPQACWDWVTFVAQKPPPGLIPVHREIAAAAAESGGLAEADVEAAHASLERIFSLNLNLQGQLGSQWGAATQAFTDALTAIQNGEPVQSALDEAQRKTRF